MMREERLDFVDIVTTMPSHKALFIIVPPRGMTTFHRVE